VRSSDATSDGAYILTREDGSQQCLHLTYRIIQWENNAKAVAVSFVNVTRLLHQQFQEGKTEVMGLVSACTSELLRPGLLRTAAELKLTKKGNPDLQLLGAFYALYCLEDLQKMLTGADLRPAIKSVHISKEMSKIESIFQPLFARYKLTYELQLTGLPDLIKLDKLRFRQVLSLLLHALAASSLPSSVLSVKLSPRSGLISNELLVTLACARSADRPASPLLALADKLLKKLGTDGLKSDSHHFHFSFFAGFASAETPLSLPQ
jgi:hypothetical protein